VNRPAAAGRWGGVRAMLIGAVLALAAAGCGRASPGTARRTGTLISPGGVRRVAVPQSTGDTPPLPAWHGRVPHGHGDVARGPRGRVWITSTHDNDGNVVTSSGSRGPAAHAGCWTRVAA
jgi:hypothetical protein